MTALMSWLFMASLNVLMVEAVEFESVFTSVLPGPRFLGKQTLLIQPITFLSPDGLVPPSRAEIDLFRL